MTLAARFTVTVALICALSPSIYAQASQEKPPRETAAKTKLAKTEEPDPMVAERRRTAVSLLTALADDARSFRDQAVRARVLARTADALWTTEQERARDLFRRAWDAAETGDAEAAQRANDDTRKQQQQTGMTIRRSGRDIRSEVLRLVAKRDRSLADEFLKKIEEATEKEAKDAEADANRRRSMEQWSAPAALAKRLALASTLLQDGEIDRAIQFAAPALTQVNRDTINFLSSLRQKRPAAADSAFSVLLATAASDPNSDANTVAGLSSYAFTPFLYITFGPQGTYQSQTGPLTGPPDLSPALRAQFFNVATGILMRPQPPPDQDTSTSGRSGKYMVIKRLLPLFEQYAPEQATELRVQMNALANDLPERGQTEGNRAIDRGIVPDNPKADPLESMQDRLDHAKTSDERDGIYADVAAAIAASGDMKARDLVGKIENSELRKQATAYIDLELARAAFQKKDDAELVRIANTGELTRIQKVWAYTQAGRLIAASDQARANDLLQEAAAEARRIEAGDPDRARGLIAVANGFVRGDRVRAWEVISEAVKAANTVEGFTGEDNQISSMLRTKNTMVMTNVSSNDFDLVGIFMALAGDDMYRSIELAKSFKSDTARANATIAVARSILEQKPAQKVAAVQ